MIQLKCIAIDDEPPALNVIREYVSKIPALQLLHTFDDAITAAEYLRQHPADLLFIDINMPDITGLDLVRSLTQKPMSFSPPLIRSLPTKVLNWMPSTTC
jgi:two-component system LytT family response regulator